MSKIQSVCWYGVKPEDEQSEQLNLENKSLVQGKITKLLKDSTLGTLKICVSIFLWNIQTMSRINNHIGYSLL